MYDEEYGELEEFHKENPTDKVWWTYPVGKDGVFLFSLDKKHLYNVLSYPYTMPPEEREIFEKENPFWAEFHGREVRIPEDEEVRIFDRENPNRAEFFSDRKKKK